MLGATGGGREKIFSLQGNRFCWLCPGIQVDLIPPAWMAVDGTPVGHQLCCTPGLLYEDAPLGPGTDPLAPVGARGFPLAPILQPWLWGAVNKQTPPPTPPQRQQPAL